MESSEHYRADELVNDSTLRLMRWYAATRLAGHENDAEDVVQDAVVRLLKSPMKRESAVSTLACRCVTYAAAERARSSEHSERLQDGAGAYDGRLSVDESGESVDVLAGLTERERQVIERRFGFNGPEMSQSDIARELGINRQRVSQLVAKALRKLRQLPR